MKPRLIPSWISNRSIFVKFLLVIIIAAVLVNMVVSYVLRELFFHPSRRFPQIFQGFANHIVQEIGDPPSLERAKELGATLGVSIRYDGSYGSWSTTPFTAPLERIRHWHHRPGRNIRFFRDHGRFFLVYRQKKEQFIFFHKVSLQIKRVELWVTFLFLSLAGVFIGVYFLLRKIFHPVRTLNEAVHKVGEGDLEFQAPVTSQDELGQLSQAFNRMTKNIKEMLYSKEQLLLAVSHELRSPLTRMKVGLELMPDSSGKKEMAEDIRQVDTMLTELLETARLNSNHGKLNFQEVELSALIRETSQRYHGESPGFTFPGPLPICRVKGDKERLRIVLQNLMENALKYSGYSGKPVEIEMEELDSRVEIRVRDRGEGIPEKEHPYLFEPFYRVDKSRSKKTGGYGLGLSLCKQIIESHQGTIEISSRVGEGTTVTIKLPKKS